MARLTNLSTNSDNRGSLTVMEVRKDIPFEVKRVYYIYGTPGDVIRGGHRHHKCVQALVCVSGSCEIFNNDGAKKEIFLLDSPAKCLLLETKDWHTMQRFSTGAVLLVLASEHYDVNDYIDEEYR